METEITRTIIKEEVVKDSEDIIEVEMEQIRLGLLCCGEPTTIIAISSKGDELRQCQEGGEYYIIHPKDQEVKE